MKLVSLRKRLRKERPMTTISMRMPADVIEELKRVAPRLGFSGYQPLVRAYVGQGLRADLERFEKQPKIEPLLQILRQHGVSGKVITSALAEARRAKKPA